nr:PREDICTED: ABC transporter C family member 1-like [Daucus carota subsp. sativus]
MAFKPFDWYCQPVADGVWAKSVENAFGIYTPCVDSLVIFFSYVIVVGLCLYRIWRIKKDFKVKRFQLRSNYYNYVLGILAAYCTAEPLFRLVMGVSAVNLDGQNGLSPFEIATLIIKALAWCSMLIMLVVETKVYILEGRWFVRFGVIYALLGDTILLNLIWSVKDFYERSVLYLYISEVFIQVRHYFFCRFNISV